MIKLKLLLNMQSIKKPSNICYKNKMSSIIISTIIILTMIKINPVYAMEHVTSAGNAIANNNLITAENLLRQIQDSNLTREQLRELDEMLNAAILTENPNTAYSVHNLELQNAGNVPDTTMNPWTRFIILVSFAMLSALTVYLIIRYWDEFKHIFWSSGTELSLEVQHAILLKKLKLVSPATHLAVQAYIYAKTGITDIAP